MQTAKSKRSPVINFPWFSKTFCFGRGCDCLIKFLQFNAKEEQRHGSIFQPQEVIKVKVIQLCKATLNTKLIQMGSKIVALTIGLQYSIVYFSCKCLNIAYKKLLYHNNRHTSSVCTWPSRMHFYRSSLCCLSFTDHMFAVCGGTSSAFLRTAQSGLHLLHLLLQHLLLLGQLLGTVREDKQRWKSINHCYNKSVPWIYMQMDLTPWPDCVAPRSPLLASGCCPPCPPPPASASSPPPGAFGCSSEGRQHNTPALMSHWGEEQHNNCTIFICWIPSKLVSASKPTTCLIDPLTAKLFKDPTVLNIVNLSLRIDTGTQTCLSNYLLT